MKTLFVNACVRSASRTRRLADHLLEKLGDEVEELNLEREGLQPLNNEVLERKTELFNNGQFDDPYFKTARRFREADRIVIAAPYWDLSFPSMLKVFVENICCVGLTFAYDEHDEPYTLCKAKEFYYVTTAGGKMVEPDHGYEYIKSVFENFFGIKEGHLIKAEMLDIIGYDVEEILKETIRKMDEEMK